MKHSINLIFIVFVASCATNIEPTSFVGPNGKSAYAMRCSGSGRTIEACYQKAGELCPLGYTIISNSAHVVGIPTNNGTIIIPKKEMAIECK